MGSRLWSRFGSVLMLLIVRLTFAQSVTTTSILSHNPACVYTGTGWVSGADYQTTVAGDSVTCTFVGNAVCVVGQVCGPPQVCNPTDTGSFAFYLDDKQSPGTFVTPTTVNPPSGSVDGYSDQLYCIGTANGTHTVTAINEVQGGLLWFQRLIVNQLDATSSAAAAASSTPASADTASSTPSTSPIAAPTTTSTTPPDTSSTTPAPSSDGADATAVGADSGSTSVSGGSSHTGAIVGGVVGGVVGLALLLLAAWYLLRRRSKRRLAGSTTIPENGSGAWHAVGGVQSGPSPEGGSHESHEMVYAPPSTQDVGIAVSHGLRHDVAAPYIADDAAAASHNLRRKPVPTVS